MKPSATATIKGKRQQLLSFQLIWLRLLTDMEWTAVAFLFQWYSTYTLKYHTVHVQMLQLYLLKKKKCYNCTSTHCHFSTHQCLSTGTILYLYGSTYLSISLSVYDAYHFPLRFNYPTLFPLRQVFGIFIRWSEYLTK